MDPGENIPEEEFTTSVNNTSYLCPSCNVSNNYRNKFCIGCGKPLRLGYSEPGVDNERIINRMLVFFVALVLLICLYGYSELFSPSFTTSLIADGMMAALVLGFAGFNYKELKPLYNISNLRVTKILSYTGLMIALAIVVHYIAGYINAGLYGYDADETWLYKQTSQPLLFSILLVGVHPAIFEEIAFRGFLFNDLLKFAKPRSVIIITGVLFAFIHFSLISLLWYVPLGLFFGYVRFRHRSLWYSTICHFVYNSTIVALEFLKG